MWARGWRSRIETSSPPLYPPAPTIAILVFLRSMANRKEQRSESGDSVWVGSSDARELPEPSQEPSGFSRRSSGDKDGVIAGNRPEDGFDPGSIDLQCQQRSTARAGMQNREVAADV